MKALFLLKRNECYGFKSYTRRSSGLWNSTRFIVEALNDNGIDAHMVEVIDNNCIDREIAQFKPNLVVVEALWVVPSKFELLKRLHPHVNWAVHLHSHVPFLALEGMAVEWLLQYAHQDLDIITNSDEAYRALLSVLCDDEVILLPNVYREEPRKSGVNKHKHHVDVGCFGAIRPMKNQLLQAMAAIQFACQRGRPLRFHINSTRLETGGEPVIKNLRALFSASLGTELIETPWYEPHDLLDHLQHNIDIGMQVSLTETFNVVTANYVTAGVPIVVSRAVDWVDRNCQVEDDDIDDIVATMHSVIDSQSLVRKNQSLLKKYNKISEKLWIKYARSFRKCD